MSSRAAAAALWEPSPPEHWYLSDGFTMPITLKTQHRENTLQQTFEARIARTLGDATIAANVALRWDQSHPGVGVDPDLLWVEPALPGGARSVLTWEKGCGVLRIAVEVVGRETAHKDYNHGPAKYAASGTRELWVFDPDGYGRTDGGEGPWVLQVWRKTRSGFRRVYAGDGPVRSTELDAWLVVVGDLLRVADDREGTKLWPTTAEERDRALARAEAAEARIRELEAKLAGG